MKFSAVISATIGFLAFTQATPPAGKYTMDKCVKCASIECMVANMSLQDKITQKIVLDFRKWRLGSCDVAAEKDFTVMNTEVADILAKYKFGDVILFAENVPSVNQTTILLNEFQKANAKTNKIPLMFSIDQEGGIVTRLGTGTMWPGNMAMGATRNSDYSYKVGAGIAKELKALGIQVNYGPDSDVNINPQNPVIGVRSFGSNTQLVSEFAVKYSQGIRSQGIISTAKHFPGHGDTSTDSHFGLPLVNKTLEEIKKVELVPFQALIDSGIDMIMTAHIQYPALDSTTLVNKYGNETAIVPATLSRKILTDLLRKEMGFDGIIATDAMNMDALVALFDLTESLSNTFKAGADFAVMPLIPRCVEDYKLLDSMIERIKKDVETGAYPLEELNDSVARILRAKKKYGILNTRTDDIDAKVSNAIAVVNNAENKALEKKVSEDSMTVIKNDPKYGIPFVVKPTDKIVAIMPNTGNEQQTASVAQAIKDYGVDVGVSTYNYTNTVYDPAVHDAWVDSATHIIIGSLVTKNTPAIDGGDIFVEDKTPIQWAYTFPQNVVKRAAEKKIPLVVLSLRNPYDAANFETAPAVIVTYGFKGYANGIYRQPNIPAAVGVALGKAKPTGKLPVDIYSIFNDTQILYPYGHGLSI
ncbi:hypothetical protein BB558_003127 [Smittium angustum]|uniref:beta-N-acetylhexosaminidase n=1 Tax=Smittium angustum TaxID=133377 RepID=A0A2U1J6X8_SMIAN|nr:hypothetical protein BB558_003127 [Smittium angustum]